MQPQCGPSNSFPSIGKTHSQPLTSWEFLVLRLRNVEQGSAKRNSLRQRSVRIGASRPTNRLKRRFGSAAFREARPIPRIIAESRFPVCDSNHNSTALPKTEPRCHRCVSPRSGRFRSVRPVYAVCAGEYCSKLTGPQKRVGWLGPLLERLQIEARRTEAGPVLTRGRRGFLEQFRDFRFQYLTLLRPKRSKPKRL